MTQLITSPGVGAPSATTRTATKRTSGLLACGVVAGPLFVAVSLIQAFTRGGFDLSRHPFSMLSLGDLGWVQITNFVVSGLLFIASALGMRQVLDGGRGGSWGPVLIGGVGISLIGGGVFLADPALGFPAGAPAGQPHVVSWQGNVHALAFVVGVLSLIAACVVFALRFAALKQRGWAVYCVATGVAFVALSALGMAIGEFRLLAVAIVLGWAWASVMAARVRTQLLSP